MRNKKRSGVYFKLKYVERRQPKVLIDKTEGGVLLKSRQNAKQTTKYAGLFDSLLVLISCVRGLLLGPQMRRLDEPSFARRSSSSHGLAQRPLQRPARGNMTTRRWHSYCCSSQFICHRPVACLAFWLVRPPSLLTQPPLLLLSCVTLASFLSFAPPHTGRNYK